MLESDDIHLCRCNASSDNRKVSIIYCVSRNIIPNIGRDKSLADDLNMLRGIVSRGVVFALRPAEIRPSYHRFVRTDISPPTYHTTSHTLQTTPHIETPLDPIETPSIHNTPARPQHPGHAQIPTSPRRASQRDTARTNILLVCTSRCTQRRPRPHARARTSGPALPMDNQADATHELGCSALSTQRRGRPQCELASRSLGPRAAAAA